jgi:hypothetical protein
MSTVTEICLALKALLETIPDVDESSIDSFFPAATTRKVALIIPPFGHRTRVEAKTAQRAVLYQSHRIRCEFWVKVDNGNLQATSARAREIGLAACRLLMREDAHSNPLRDTVSKVGFYGLDGPGPALEVEVTDRPVQIGQVPYIVATVLVGVIDYADALP